VILYVVGMAKSEHPQQKPVARFEVYKDRQKQYRWRFRGPSGEAVAESSSAHNSKADCLSEIELVKNESPIAETLDPTASLDDVKPKSRKRTR